MHGGAAPTKWQRKSERSEREKSRTRDRERVTRRRSLNGGVLCVFVWVTVCVSCIFDFALQYFWLNASWAHCLCSVYFTLNTNIERLHYFSPPFLLPFFSFLRALHDCTMERRRWRSFTHWLIPEREYIYFQLSIKRIPHIKCSLFYFLTDLRHNAKTRTTCMCSTPCRRTMLNSCYGNSLCYVTVAKTTMWLAMR